MVTPASRLAGHRTNATPRRRIKLAPVSLAGDGGQKTDHRLFRHRPRVCGTHLLLLPPGPKPPNTFSRVATFLASGYECCQAGGRDTSFKIVVLL